jgi:hypothetical protein
MVRRFLVVLLLQALAGVIIWQAGDTPMWNLEAWVYLGVVIFLWTVAWNIMFPMPPTRRNPPDE